LQLTPRQFEEFVAEPWQRFGYDVELTKRTRDGGHDVVAVGRLVASTRFLIECKRFDPSNKVGVSIVRQLHGVKTHERATKGILATTSYLTADAEEFIDDHYWELEARDHQGIIDWVKLACQGH
jgi:restriction endonuclease Mrr